MAEEGDLSDCPIQLQATQSARGSPSHITNTVVCFVKGKMNWKKKILVGRCVTAEYFVKDRGEKVKPSWHFFIVQVAERSGLKVHKVEHDVV